MLSPTPDNTVTDTEPKLGICLGFHKKPALTPEPDNLKGNHGIFISQKKFMLNYKTTSAPINMVKNCVLKMGNQRLMNDSLE